MNPNTSKEDKEEETKQANQDKAAHLLQWAAHVQANDQQGDFDPIKAHLLISSHILPPDVAAAFRAEADLLLKKGRGTWSDVSETARLRAIPYPKKRKSKKNKKMEMQKKKEEEEKEKDGANDGFPWTEEEFELLKKLRAEKMSWKKIAEHFPDKTKNACQTKFFREKRAGRLD